MAHMRKGGTRGPAVVPGKPELSVLYRLISGGEPRMPRQGEPLNAAEVESIRQWIESGAPWTESAEWWSLQPLTRPAPPGVTSSWVRTPIDAFILARLKEKGLHAIAGSRSTNADPPPDLRSARPAAVAGGGRRVCCRPAPDAYEQLVDRLLASPRYGERWGRHWLDAAHYGESHGYDKDKPRRNAWPYRDYVIRSFNEDKPYARFVKEQLAGDVLFPDDPEGDRRARVSSPPGRGTSSARPNCAKAPPTRTSRAFSIATTW